MSNQKKFFVSIIISSILLSSIFGASLGFVAGAMSTSDNKLSNWLKKEIFNIENNNETIKETKKVITTIEEESSIIEVVEKVSPAVVSIIVTKDLPVMERYYSNPFSDDFFGNFFNFRQPQYRQKGTEKREIGGGTGFLVSVDGYIATNKHVVEDEEADYTVLMNDETKLSAKVLARDPITDLAILKVEANDWPGGDDFPNLEFGDSETLKVGQTVIAIGNSLGEFRNTVSTGVVSGLSRSITAGGGGQSEQLMGVIQTDASINPGNSGGPLLNLAGQVIGINTAMAQGAENIGFSIPVNEIKNTVESVKENGRIIRPWLGVRYAMITEKIAEDNKLDIDYGALIVRGDTRTDLAVMPGSPADKAGLQENDIIMEIDDEKITTENTLAQIIARKQATQKIKLKIMRKGKEEMIEVVLEEVK